MKISMIVSNTSVRGPGKVYQNLMLGLSNIPGVEVSTNNPNAERFGMLQYVGHVPFANGSNTLYGPNLFVLPKDNPKLCSQIKDIVVPSEWVKNLYRQFKELDHANIHVWPVGIDTKEWKPLSNSMKDLDCLLYFKNRTLEDKQAIEKILRERQLSYVPIEYGAYTEEQLKKLCDRAKFAVLVTGTESQGIAYMQILSMNLPCYVFNQSSWKDDANTVTCDATSVPYFDENTCGLIENDVSKMESSFSTFIDKLSLYSPRAYIENNHGIIKSAKQYLEILSKV